MHIKYYQIVFSAIGLLVGFLFIHPLSHFVMETLVVEDKLYINLDINNIFFILTDSFQIKYWPHMILYSILSASVGYFYGKKIKNFELFKIQSERLSHIGLNASVILHDINNPLTGLSGYAQLLERDTKDKVHSGYIKKIIINAEKISKMINDIRLYASGKFKESNLKLKNIKVSDFIKEIIEKFNPVFKVKYKFGYGGFAELNINDIERVIWNILKNSEEAFDNLSESEVVISTSLKGEQLIILLEDNGKGIAKDDLIKIFDFGISFDKINGSGLGLFSCKKIIESNNGTIHITSKVNKGTQVSIFLPVIKS